MALFKVVNAVLFPGNYVDFESVFLTVSVFWFILDGLSFVGSVGLGLFVQEFLDVGQVRSVFAEGRCS